MNPDLINRVMTAAGWRSPGPDAQWFHREGDYCVARSTAEPIIKAALLEAASSIRFTKDKQSVDPINRSFIAREIEELAK